MKVKKLVAGKIEIHGLAISLAETVIFLGALTILAILMWLAFF